MSRPHALLATVVLASGALTASALITGDGRDTHTETPVELGLVKWERNFDAAKETAESADKPILLLFQEVPG